MSQTASAAAASGSGSGGGGGGGGGGVNITTLPIPQLSQLQSRLSQELEHLSTSYQRLRAAQARFKDCIRSIHDGVRGKSGSTPLLIPLTASLYVPATLDADRPDTVLVDVGTGFYVEKSAGEGVRFYEGKVKELEKNLGEIEKAVGGKNESLGVVEDVLRSKVLAQQQGQQGQQQEGGGG